MTNGLRVFRILLTVLLPDLSSVQLLRLLLGQQFAFLLNDFLELCDLVFTLSNQQHVRRRVSFPAHNLAELVFLLLQSKNYFTKLLLCYCFQVRHNSQKVNHFLSIPLVNLR